MDNDTRQPSTSPENHPHSASRFQNNDSQNNEGSAPQERSSLPERNALRRLLKLIAVVSWLAFAAAFMPEKWFVEISEFFHLETFPQSSLGFYLARHLSLLYGFVGVLLWVLASDLDRYLPLVRKVSKMTIVFGGLQLMMDFACNMPLWWTFTESLSTIATGFLVLMMCRGEKCPH